MNFKATIPIVFACTILGCGPKPMQNKNTITYLALGDSYSIGEKVPAQKAWPNQLIAELNQNGRKVSVPKIIAITGWTTGDLLAAMEKELGPDEKYDLVSVLIGVNNQYQKKSIADYEKDLRIIFQKAINHCSQGKNGVFVLSIPDYAVTPFGKEKDKTWDISGEIEQYNSVCKKVAEEFGFPFYDITPISLKAETDPDLLAEDGLHPSGKMYKLWVEEIVDEVERKLP